MKNVSNKTESRTLGLRREQRSPPRQPLRAFPAWGRPCTLLPGQQLTCGPQHSKDKRTQAGTSGGSSERGCCRCKRAAGTPCTRPEGSVSRQPDPLFKPARVGRCSLSISFWFFQEKRLRCLKEAIGKQKLPSEMGTQKKPL